MNDITPQRLKYPNSPIQETICEIHFALPQPLKPEEMKRIQEIWKAEYPNQQLVAEKSIQFQFSVEKIEAQPRETGHKLIARSADEKKLAQLGPGFLAVNRLRPYVGWEEEFRDTIMARLTEVQTVYGFTELRRLGLRYINKIDVEQSPLNWSEWFAVPLPLPASVPKTGGVFQSHFRQRLSENMEAILNFGTLPVQVPHRTSVILDIDVIWRGTAPVANAAEHLEEIHLPHRDLFEGYLLDKTRSLFQIG